MSENGARLAGLLAAQRGAKRSDNPYPEGDPKHAAWAAGWKAANR